MPALVRAAEEATDRKLTPAEIFRGAAKGNIDLQETAELGSSAGMIGAANL